MKHRVLIVEDEARMRGLLAENFIFEGYEAMCAGDGHEALTMAQKRTFDLIVLDVMLPAVNGLDVCRTLRERGDDTAIILLTARGQESERVSGLRAGADDYVTKPFSILELLARSAAILRRTSRPALEELTSSQFGKISLDFVHYTARRGKKPLDLSVREFEILKTLIHHAGVTVSRAQLLAEAWPRGAAPTPRTIDSHIRNLRAQIEDDPLRPAYILTVAREGYRFVAPESRSSSI